MPVDSKHPRYTLSLPDWRTMKHAYAGERTIKEQGTEYLPATSGMYVDGYPAVNSVGWKAYDAYRKRAIYHNLVAEAVKTLVGIMHHKPPTIELPQALEDMRENATTQGESLEMLLRRVNEAQLVTGRYGLLLDLPSAPTLENLLPYIATYDAHQMLNWDDGRREEIVLQNLNFVSLDESEYERQEDFEWEKKDKYRVLILGDPQENEGSSSGQIYRVGVFTEKNANFSEAALVTPSVRGRALDKIPFVFVNSKDIVPDPDDPPLMSLARLCLAIYRGEADYRQSLFMQGQDTLVVIGDGQAQDGNAKTYRTGANAVIALQNVEADAKFIGVDSSGLEEQRQAVENDKKDAATMAGQLMDNASRGVESGDALQIRVGARTATLNEVAITGAFALQKILRIAAEWVGANPEEVVVQPNLDFVDDRLDGKSLIEYITAKTLGAPLSLESIHKLMQDKGLTELDLETELQRISEEGPLVEPIVDDSGLEDDPEE